MRASTEAYSIVAENLYRGLHAIPSKFLPAILSILPCLIFVPGRNEIRMTTSHADFTALNNFEKEYDVLQRGRLQGRDVWHREFPRDLQAVRAPASWCQIGVCHAHGYEISSYRLT